MCQPDKLILKFLWAKNHRDNFEGECGEELILQDFKSFIDDRK